MNKKILVALIVGVLVSLTVVLIFVYRGRIQEEPGEVAVEEFNPALVDTMLDKDGFRILLPQGWTDYGGPEELVAILGGDEDSYLMGEWAEIRLIGLPKTDETLDKYKEELYQSLQADIDGAAGSIAVRQRNDLIIAERPAHYIEAWFDQDEPVVSGLYLIEGEEHIWHLATISPADKWDGHQTLFSRIIESLELKR